MLVAVLGRNDYSSSHGGDGEWAAGALDVTESKSHAPGAGRFKGFGSVACLLCMLCSTYNNGIGVVVQADSLQSLMLHSPSRRIDAPFT